MDDTTQAVQSSRQSAPPPLSAVERVVARGLPGVADALFVLVLLGTVFVLQSKVLGVDGDIGWHIRLGLSTLGGQLPRADFFSYTAAGRPLVGMEWLAEVCYAAAWRLAGLNGVVALAGVLIAGTSAGLFVALRRRATPLLLALPLALLAIGLTSIHWVARPHLFSFPLTLWWSEWLWRYWRDGRCGRLWAFPVVMVLWVNLHGGFVSGLILLGTGVAAAWLFPRARGKANPRALTATLVACLAATFANPWGWSWIGYFAAYFADPLVTANTQELQSPDFHTLVGRLFLALLLLLAACWVLGRRERISLASAPADPAAGMPAAVEPVTSAPAVATSVVPGGPEPLAWMTAGIWTILALFAVRAMPLWALMVTPILAEALTARLRDGAPLLARLRLLRWWAPAAARFQRLDAIERLVGRGLWASLALVFTLTTVLAGGRLPFTDQTVLDVRFPATVFPVAAVSRLQRIGVPAGHLFNTVQWGGYLEYALPSTPVFIDSRADFYGARLLGDYLAIMAVGPQWQTLLDHYQVTWALLPANLALTQVLRLSAGWSCRSLDSSQVAVLCIRRHASGP